MQRCTLVGKVDDMTDRFRAKLPSALRLPIAGALFVISTAASGQFLEESKSIKFGSGCQERIKPIETGLGTCLIAEKRAASGVQTGKCMRATESRSTSPWSDRPAV